MVGNPHALHAKVRYTLLFLPTHTIKYYRCNDANATQIGRSDAELGMARLRRVRWPRGEIRKRGRSVRPGGGL